MLTKRIIPCLDIKNGRTVKGVNFENMIDAGDPVELAIRYCEEGADELVFLDISATNEKRKTLVDLVKRVATNCNIPFIVGGGISSVEDVELLLNAGADKISINSAAVKNPDLIGELAKRFGSQCVILAIDAKKIAQSKWNVFLNGGTLHTGMDVLDWALRGQDLGAGELLLTSMDADGTKNGFSNELNYVVSSKLSIPLIASGGAGSKEHFYDAFEFGKADAVLAASVFHFKDIEIKELKEYLSTKNISIRI